MNQQSLMAQERRSAFSLAAIFSFRMMGLFMILPVFSLYAESLEGTHVTPLLIGLAIGIYGLTQALFQIPFGMLSDRYGRKPVITLGLLIFALGSIVAAVSDSISGIIIGRALQGSGAIAAAVMALAADLTREEHRTKAMAIIGMSIGVSFAVSLVLGPLLNAWIGVPGIFWLTVVFAFLGIVMVKFIVPDPGKLIVHRDTEPVPAYFLSVLRNTQLLRLDFGILSLHFMLTASFVVLPFALRDYASIQTAHHWYIYLPVLLISLIAMVPLVILAEKNQKMKQVYLAAILTLVIAQFAFAGLYQSAMGLVVALLIFFLAFNVLEALLPSLIVKYASADKKGTAMGVYSTSQFVGAFCGGLIGGAVFGAFGIAGVFLTCAAVGLIWVFWAISMQSPPYLSSYMFHIEATESAEIASLEKQLQELPGVVEVCIIEEERAAYLKVDKKIVDFQVLEGFSTHLNENNGTTGENCADDTESAGEVGYHGVSAGSKQARLD
ncbi:MAG: MFS transporter [Gammaproteobacteria bacterium]